MKEPRVWTFWVAMWVALSAYNFGSLLRDILVGAQGWPTVVVLFEFALLIYSLAMAGRELEDNLSARAAYRKARLDRFSFKMGGE